MLQTLLEKGRFLELLARWPFLCPKFRVYFYSLNEKENEPCTRPCSALLPPSKMNAAGRNVFIEDAACIHQRAMLFCFKHGLKLPCDESAKKKKNAHHILEGWIGSFIVVLLV